MRIDTFLVGLIIMSTVIILFAYVAEDVTTRYGAPYEDSFNKSFTNITQDLSQMSITQKGNLLDPTTNVGVLGYIDAAATQAGALFTALTTPITVVNKIATTILSVVLPEQAKVILVAVGTIMTILIVFGIAYIYFNIRSW